MCGILAILNYNNHRDDDTKLIEELVENRGPDFKSVLRQYPTGSDQLSLTLKSSVLHLRGPSLESQPFVFSNGSLLQFNGQIYKFLGIPIDENVSDTKFLANKLELCKSKDEILETFAEIDGPFAFVYWSKDLRCLFYGRDIFGRRSLCSLGNISAINHPIVISSVAPDVNLPDFQQTVWSEVSCKGLHCIDFSINNQVEYHLYQWDLECVYPQSINDQQLQATDEKPDFCKKLKARPLAPICFDKRSDSSFSNFEKELVLRGLEEKLLQSVYIRVHSDVNLCHQCRKETTLLQGHSMKDCHHSKVAVAFSGGIDSTLLALALDKVIPSEETIDLVTVAFKADSPDRESAGAAYKELRNISKNRNWRLVLCDISKPELEYERGKLIKFLISPYKSVMDDSLGCACWFIGRARGRSLDSLIDDEIFDNHLEDFLKFDDGSTSMNTFNEQGMYIKRNYTSPATMFFVGGGIDEQLGGYSSHRSAWKKDGCKGVCDEISFLMARISSRNLGRDDRVYSHHGRDVKLPYLDFDLVSYLNQLPVCLKMNLDESLEIGPKKILRDLALHWGLIDTSKRIKRALQFGTRIARLENAKEKGDDICGRLV